MAKPRRDLARGRTGSEVVGGAGVTGTRTVIGAPIPMASSSCGCLWIPGAGDMRPRKSHSSWEVGLLLIGQKFSDA
jgi:hypothetical protein